MSQEDITNVIPEKLYTRLQRIVQLADHLLLRQIQLENEQQTLDSSQSFVDESVSDLISAIDSALEAGNAQLRMDGVEEVRKWLRSDVDVMKLHTARVKVIRGEIVKLETRLKRRAEKLAQSRRSRNFTTARLSDSEIETNTSSPCSTPKSETPSLLAKLYDRKGDVGIYRERLLELGWSHEEGLTDREMVIDRGDEPLVSAQEFEAKYQGKRKAILEDMEKGEADVAALMQECEAAGLQVAGLARGPFSETPEDATSSGDADD